VTAYDTSKLESDYSNEVSKRVDSTPPSRPSLLVIEIMIRIDSSVGVK